MKVGRCQALVRHSHRRCRNQVHYNPWKDAVDKYCGAHYAWDVRDHHYAEKGNMFSLDFPCTVCPPPEELDD